jgi:pimeloyl-ACP methyl ester carboxylesterase
MKVFHLAAATLAVVVSSASIVAAAVPAVATGSAVTSEEFTPAPIEWGDCADEFLAEAGAECGVLVVPLDYERPHAEQVRLAVSRIEHTTSDDEYQGAMIVNPGGPGGAGLPYSVIGGWLPDGAGDSYDWIGFDPRGVGSSEPALSCDSTYTGYDRPLYEPVTPALEHEWLAKSEGYAQDCAKAGGDLLDHVTTVDTVRDVDSLRTALGLEEINFYGFSYGTYIAQVYATLFPDRVGRMVLDGVVDPQKVWYQANLDQDVAFESSIGKFFEWVARYDSVYHLGTSAHAVELRYYAERTLLLAAPAAGVIGPDEFNDIMLSAGYYVYGWENTAAAFSAWANARDAEPLLALSTPPGEPGDGSDNGYAMYLATQCTDAAWPTDWDTWRYDNWLTFTKAPFETWGNAWFNAPCLFWNAEPSVPVEVDGTDAPAILLVNETLDGATPYEGAQTVRELFPRSVLIEGVGGSTHAGSLSGVACTDDTIASYLRDGTLPERVAGSMVSDVQCPPVPEPDPLADAGPAVASGTAARAASLTAR